MGENLPKDPLVLEYKKKIRITWFSKTVEA